MKRPVSICLERTDFRLVPIVGRQKLPYGAAIRNCRSVMPVVCWQAKTGTFLKWVAQEKLGGAMESLALNR